jgi:excisionase family DNA binding protein
VILVVSPEALTVKHVAKILSVHPNTVYTMIADGRLPAFRIGGRAVRIARIDLLMFRNNRRVAKRK